MVEEHEKINWINLLGYRLPQSVIDDFLKDRPIESGMTQTEIHDSFHGWSLDKIIEVSPCQK